MNTCSVVNGVDCIFNALTHYRINLSDKTVFRRKVLLSASTGIEFQTSSLIKAIRANSDTEELSLSLSLSLSSKWMQQTRSVSILGKLLADTAMKAASLVSVTEAGRSYIR